MLDLTAICQALPVDAPVQIQSKVAGLWAVVGSGRLTALEAHSLAFDGEIHAIEPGPVSLRLSLSEGGAATLSWRGGAGERGAWFAYDDGVVVTATIGGRAGELTLLPGGGGVYVTLAGAVSARLWLGV